MINNFNPKNKLLTIVASPRKNGNSEVIANLFVKGAKTLNLETETINISDLKFSSCVGCELCRKDNICKKFNDDMTTVYNKIITSKGLLLVSPVYNYNITAWMKAFLDRLYCFYDFELPRPGKWGSKLSNQGRLAVIASVCEQLDEEDIDFTLSAMNKPIQALGYKVIKKIKVLGAFEKGGILKNKRMLAEVEKAGKNLAKKLLTNY
ncbi:flavodoxin family protein [Deferribacteraceae bacterium V6Fe1]|nr:flavodoxin family protein [Deferribacteraceae bacterium V6Fe1]